MAIDLTPFVLAADAPCIWQVHAPFIRDGYRYATDGRIIVRLPAPGEPSSQGSIPGVGGLAWPGLPAPARLPWPALSRTRGDEPCPLCRCATCDGEGWVYTHETGRRCKPCKGTGNLGCGDCGGLGHMIQDVYQRIGGRFIRVRYDDAIRALPGVALLVPYSPVEPILFAFDGGEGMVMPVEVPP